uniref:Uncharacterized protein n=1 Tax=Cyclophora tenuis TaxID=216820 RepID=A0A7S1GG53_CYCTE|mmetsp:Transcript_11199/g.19019  ORF Transcript_11199/g.19019 Transcript_11199/m.19019 type:complete len:123 (+) Transcript_11199:2-370(+)
MNPDNNDVAVVDAVSFGTRDLSNNHKNEFHAERRDRLFGVMPNQWRRPQAVENPDDAAWTLAVPFQGMVYRVMTEERDDGTRPYLVDVLEDSELGDLTVDLRTMKTQYSAFLYNSDDDDDNK